MKTKLRNQKGFTIIEVLIVLAIAGLIMLVVFLAVPALQRNARNNTRRTDASQLLAQLNNEVTNANGTSPATCTGATATCWVRNVKLGQIDNNVAGTAWTKDPASLVAAPTTADTAVIQNKSNCSGNVAAVDTSARKFTIVFTLETQGGFTTGCIES